MVDFYITVMYQGSQLIMKQFYWNNYLRMSRRNAPCMYVFIIQLELKSHLFSVTNCSVNITFEGESTSSEREGGEGEGGEREAEAAEQSSVGEHRGGYWGWWAGDILGSGKYEMVFLATSWILCLCSFIFCNLVIRWAIKNRGRGRESRMRRSAAVNTGGWTSFLSGDSSNNNKSASVCDRQGKAMVV